VHEGAKMSFAVLKLFWSGVSKAHYTSNIKILATFCVHQKPVVMMMMIQCGENELRSANEIMA